MKLRIAENFRAVFYAPFYAIRALGLAAREGLEIDWLPSGAPGSTIEQVKRGTIDAQWGGPMRVLKDHDSTPDDGARLLSFGEVVWRDPFYLIGRERSFKLKDAAAARAPVAEQVGDAHRERRQQYVEQGHDHDGDPAVRADPGAQGRRRHRSPASGCGVHAVARRGHARDRYFRR